MQCTLQDALDDINSSRSSSNRRTRALAVLEQQLALACVPSATDDTLDTFLSLQDTFQCNVPSRMLSWVTGAIPYLEAMLSKVSVDKDRDKEVGTLCFQIFQSLSIIQGVVLHHTASKSYLSRCHSLEILVDLLLVSRHTPLITPAQTSSTGKTSPTVHLSSAVLDTFLCILVDSPPALRAFEEVNGVQSVVKILKRAGTPREVRMKCLEFLYFYLMDESSEHQEATSRPSSPISTVPNTPMRPPRKIFPRPASGASAISIGSSSTSSSRSTTSSSFSSFSSSTTQSSVFNSRAPSPVKKSQSYSNSSDPHTPPNSPPPVSSGPKHGSAPLQARSLLMLKREVEYEPQSPKKVQVARLGVGEFIGASTPSASRLRDTGSNGSVQSQAHNRADSDESLSTSEGGFGKESALHIERDPGSSDRATSISKRERVRTTEEKKEILGGMLGNVDALVEGVRKAGVWGLG
ncbi:cell division control protein 14, SIN component-domain-containing protein [Hygrophoropsis aurantiaca]|uniref:Cell division control protein 14, SIN component-domain-containing protein n=1 Tax=Hygrophoropsis aurantiaca TaxID=72124 RepID=A0ACB8AM44_9AGAM|nr:cell division control protein 14, SIN component-domain-containing protein [Hygrophoropsis aurantiaca]